jgi:hypothetical protein
MILRHRTNIFDPLVRSRHDDSKNLVAPIGGSRFVSSCILMSGILLLPLQFVKISLAQPVHLWIVVAISFLVLKRAIHVTLLEIVIYTLFITLALFDTYETAYGRVKESEQVLKFVAVYPACFLVGRWSGIQFPRQALPFGWFFILGSFAAEYIIQEAQVPILWQPVAFMQGSLYGTFLERNWLALYFFGLSYLIFLKQRPTISNGLKLFLSSLLITALSNSKSVMVACGIVLLIQIRGRYTFKAVAIVTGAFLYMSQFTREFADEAIQDRLDGERGLAYSESIRLFGENIFGYGFGFVESYFSNVDFKVQGLGEGVNSVFSAPLDLLLIAGPFGLIFWAVFFAGLGLRSVKLLAPFAAWSLLAPLHQSEICYLFSGILVSWGMGIPLRRFSIGGRAANIGVAESLQ